MTELYKASSLADPRGAAGTLPHPQWDPIPSFSHVSTKKHPCWKLVPPMGRRPQLEILDLPLSLVDKPNETKSILTDSFTYSKF